MGISLVEELTMVFKKPSRGSTHVNNEGRSTTNLLSMSALKIPGVKDRRQEDPNLVKCSCAIAVNTVNGQLNPEEGGKVLVRLLKVNVNSIGMTKMLDGILESFKPATMRWGFPRS